MPCFTLDQTTQVPLIHRLRWWPTYQCMIQRLISLTAKIWWSKMLPTCSRNPSTLRCNLTRFDGLIRQSYDLESIGLWSKHCAMVFDGFLKHLIIDQRPALKQQMESNPNSNRTLKRTQCSLFFHYKNPLIPWSPLTGPLSLEILLA